MFEWRAKSSTIVCTISLFVSFFFCICIYRFLFLLYSFSLYPRFFRYIISSILTQINSFATRVRTKWTITHNAGSSIISQIKLPVVILLQSCKFRNKKVHLSLSLSLIRIYNPLEILSFYFILFYILCIKCLGQLNAVYRIQSDITSCASSFCVLQLTSVFWYSFYC